MTNDELKIELTQIMSRNGGTLPPERVVEAARPEGSALHAYFDWDDRVAGDKWRLQQARELIRSVRISIPNQPPVEVRAFVSLAADRASGLGYRAMQEVMSNEFLRRQLAEEMLSMSRKWAERASVLGVAFSPKPIERAAQAVAAKRKGRRA